MHHWLWNLHSLAGAELAETVAAIPAGVTTLNLSENDLGNKTDAEIRSLLCALPANVNNIILDNNKIFTQTSIALSLAAQDQRLRGINQSRHPMTFFSLNGNGSSELSRTICPLVGIYRQRVHSFSIVSNILQYIIGNSRNQAQPRPAQPSANQIPREYALLSKLTKLAIRNKTSPSVDKSDEKKLTP